MTLSQENQKAQQHVLLRTVVAKEKYLRISIIVAGTVVLLLSLLGWWNLNNKATTLSTATSISVPVTGVDPLTVSLEGSTVTVRGAPNNLKPGNVIPVVRDSIDAEDAYYASLTAGRTQSIQAAAALGVGGVLAWFILMFLPQTLGVKTTRKYENSDFVKVKILNTRSVARLTKKLWSKKRWFDTHVYGDYHEVDVCVLHEPDLVFTVTVQGLNDIPQHGDMYMFNGTNLGSMPGLVNDQQVWLPTPTPARPFVS